MDALANLAGLTLAALVGLALATVLITGAERLLGRLRRTRDG